MIDWLIDKPPLFWRGLFLKTNKMKKLFLILSVILLIGCEYIRSDYSAIIYEGTEKELNESATIHTRNHLLFSTDNNGLKRGNGEDKFKDLDWINPGISSGAYTPITSYTSNVNSVDFKEFTYMVIGNIVIVSGYADVNSASYVNRNLIRISVPVGDKIKNVSGSVTGMNTGHNSEMFGYVTENQEQAYFTIKAGNTGVSHCHFQFMYEVE